MSRWCYCNSVVQTNRQTHAYTQTCIHTHTHTHTHTYIYIYIYTHTHTHTHTHTYIYIYIYWKQFLSRFYFYWSEPPWQGSLYRQIFSVLNNLAWLSCLSACLPGFVWDLPRLSSYLHYVFVSHIKAHFLTWCHPVWRMDTAHNAKVRYPTELNLLIFSC